MNKKLSGCQAVLVPIKQLGVNKFPFVENLNDRYIKYIDFAPATHLPDTDAVGLNSSDNIFVTLTNDYGNTQLIKDLPLARFDYEQTFGVRQTIGSTLCLSDCYLLNQDVSNIGKTALLVFWYDLPEFSQRNMTDNIIVDSLTVPLTTAIRYNKLPDNDRMTGKRFRRILVTTPTTTPDGYYSVPFSSLSSIYLTLRKGSYNVVENLPIKLLYQLTKQEKTEFANIIFDFQSSYITLGGAGALSSLVGMCIFMNLIYEK